MEAKIGQQIGERVRDLRLEKGVSLRQFAIDAGFNPNILSRIERGDHKMTLETLFRLSRSLGVTPADLLKDLA